MYWKGKTLKTMGDLMDAVLACGDRDEAHDFMRAYELDTPHAKDNIGYLAGYVSHEQATRIFDWFSCQHPIFGTRFPSPDEAFQMGMKLGEYTKKYGSEKAMEMLGLKPATNPNPWFVGALNPGNN